jgi:AraC-like DNA-binding protein
VDVFESVVGLTPKRFARVRRFQRVLRQMRQGADVRWTDVALACGYYDQAHFIREFEAFAGLNPSRYRAAAPVYPNHVPL